jgi:hypothetical protein
MSNIRAGIANFLKHSVADSPYLIPKWSIDLESQFLVHPGNEEVEGSANTWTDGSETWCQHRWPSNAGTAPSYVDRPLTFSPMAHLTRVGSTWWDFKNRRSVAVALDIDLEGEHAESTTTVTPAKLAELTKRLAKLDYLTLVRSSGGGGVHIYCFFDEDNQPHSENHNEHTQVAHALVAKISEDLNYDLTQHMDAVGVVFWLWSCDSPAGHPGYELIKEQTKFLKAEEIGRFMGLNMAGPNQKIKVKGFNESGDQVTNTEEGGGYKTYDLEPAHSEILKELEDMGYSYIWTGEYNMAHTHTCALKALFEKRKAEGRPLKGFFETISKGTDKTKPNCYMTPRPDGVFQIKRFGTRTAEHALWNTREDDTWCYLNQDTQVLPVLKRFGAGYDGIKLTITAQDLETVMNAFGETLGESHKAIGTSITVIKRADGTFGAQIESDGHFDGWQRRGKKLIRTLPLIHKKAEFNKTLLEEADDVVRFVVTPEHDPYGWAVKSGDNWIMFKSFDPVGCVLQNMFGKDAAPLKAEMTTKPWVLHHEPFGKEYPGDRKWNKHAPQLAIEPAKVAGPHQHWDMVMDHLGKTLDETVTRTNWCSQWGIHTGADYLRYWTSALIQDPMEPLPYLFFYGPQDSGKSIFHEAGYNFEVANAILGYVEEKDLSAVADTAYTRIKEWIMAKTMLIHQKGHTPYQQPNTLHMCHMANKPTACPMEDGDTRITAILVQVLQRIIPKKALARKLVEEAPFFLRTILTIDLPESHTRLRVPMLASEHKRDLEEMHQTPFESFTNEVLIPCEGQSVKFSDFYAKYKEFCAARSEEPAKKSHVIQLIRNRADKWVLGYGTGKQNRIANMTMDRNAKPKKKLVLNEKGRLIHV